MNDTIDTAKTIGNSTQVMCGLVWWCCKHDGPGLERDMQALILLLCIFFVCGERLHPEMAWITNNVIQSIQFTFGGDFFSWWVAPLVQMFTFECLFCEQSISEFIDQINSRDWNALVCVCAHIFHTHYRCIFHLFKYRIEYSVYRNWRMTRDSLDFYKWRSLNNEFVIHILTMVGI